MDNFSMSCLSPHVQYVMMGMEIESYVHIHEVGQAESRSMSIEKISM